jgi:hypothetical protein
MDRTIGKSENRNNDGERLMISLLEIAQSINEVDDDKIIKYKDKDGESQEMTAGAAKKQPDDHPAKVAYNKMADQGGDDSEKDAGGKLSGSDFERDGGDNEDKPDMDSDDSDSADAEDDVKADLRKNPEKLDDMSAEELEDVFPSHEEYMEFETLRNQKVLKDRHPKLHKLASQSIQAKQELESLEKELKDKLGSGEFADPFVKGKEDPEGKKKFEDHQQKIKDAEEKMEDASLEVYYYQQDNANALDGDDIPYDVEDLVRGEENKKDESIKVINGKTYKPIKEGKKKSNPRILKEIYDRTFRSLK